MTLSDRPPPAAALAKPEIKKIQGLRAPFY